MTKEDLFVAVGEIDDSIVKGAKINMKKVFGLNFKQWGAVAACLCIVACGAIAFNSINSNSVKPSPEFVQVVSPILEVESHDEMEKYLDFSVPVLDKDVENYIVLVIDGYPETARINYRDGATFNMKYGSGDISGIHGGELQCEKEINGTSVAFYKYTNSDGSDSDYAIWEKNGFTYSLSGGETPEYDVATLIK